MPVKLRKLNLRKGRSRKIVARDKDGNKEYHRVAMPVYRSLRNVN